MVNYSRKRSCMPPFCYLPQINISKNDHACHPFVISLKLKSGYLSEINIRGHQNVLPFCHLVNLYSRICWRFLHCSVLAETSRRAPQTESGQFDLLAHILIATTIPHRHVGYARYASDGDPHQKVVVRRS